MSSICLATPNHARLVSERFYHICRFFCKGYDPVVGSRARHPDCSLTAQLARNNLTSAGTPTVAPRGGNSVLPLKLAGVGHYDRVQAANSYGWV
jgi:hypothetical protein